MENFNGSHQYYQFSLQVLGVPRGSVVKCLTRHLGVLSLSHIESSGFFRRSALGQDTPEPQSSTLETQERHE